MIIKRITILLTLFIFCIVIQVWADPTGTLDGTFYEGNLIKMKKLEEEERHQPGTSYKDYGEAPDDTFLESPKANKRLRFVESIDKIFSLHKLGETAWRYKFLDHQGVKKTESLNSEYGPSILNLHSNVNRYLEEGGAQVMFELLQSKLKRTELFILFHLSFSLKEEQMFLEMHVTPSTDKGVNFFVPF